MLDGSIGVAANQGLRTLEVDRPDAPSHRRPRGPPPRRARAARGPPAPGRSGARPSLDDRPSPAERDPATILETRTDAPDSLVGDAPGSRERARPPRSRRRLPRRRSDGLGRPRLPRLPRARIVRGRPRPTRVALLSCDDRLRAGSPSLDDPRRRPLLPKSWRRLLSHDVSHRPGSRRGRGPHRAPLRRPVAPPRLVVGSKRFGKLTVPLHPRAAPGRPSGRPSSTGRRYRRAVARPSSDPLGSRPDTAYSLLISRLGSPRPSRSDDGSRCSPYPARRRSIADGDARLSRLRRRLASEFGGSDSRTVSSRSAARSASRPLTLPRQRSAGACATRSRPSSPTAATSGRSRWPRSGTAVRYTGSSRSPLAPPPSHALRSAGAALVRGRRPRHRLSAGATGRPRRRTARGPCPSRTLKRSVQPPVRTTRSRSTASSPTTTRPPTWSRSRASSRTRATSSRGPLHASASSSRALHRHPRLSGVQLRRLRSAGPAVRAARPRLSTSRGSPCGRRPRTPYGPLWPMHSASTAAPSRPGRRGVALDRSVRLLGDLRAHGVGGHEARGRLRGAHPFRSRVEPARERRARSSSPEYVLATWAADPAACRCRARPGSA